MTVYGCNINGKDPEWLDHMYVDGIYLHGVAENKNGYDLIGIKETPIKDGIYDVSIVYHTGEKAEGKLFFWKSKETSWVRGLVVENGDDKYMKDAERKFNERRECI